ncbi:MAG: response regulator [Bdellovibrionales bacterium]|nr:response regulator [Bdellovibrionales bacterium]
MTLEPFSILIVDDDDTFCERLAMAFRDRSWLVNKAKNGHEAIKLLETIDPEFAVIDLQMPGMNGIDLLEKILKIDPQTQVVMLTGYGSIATAIEAIRKGAKHYLTKPVNIEDILRAFDTHEVITKNDTHEPITKNDIHEAESAHNSPTPSLARMEWEHIQRVLTESQGNISEAARRLKIHRRSLQRKLQKKPPKI